MSDLSKRQLQIVTLLAEGYTREDISHRLNLSVYTVKAHIHNVFEKLGAKNVAHMVAIAYQERWLTVPDRRQPQEAEE